jgi:hypothetical protein
MPLSKSYIAERDARIASAQTDVDRMTRRTLARDARIAKDFGASAVPAFEPAPSATLEEAAATRTQSEADAKVSAKREWDRMTPAEQRRWSSETSYCAYRAAELSGRHMVRGPDSAGIRLPSFEEWKAGQR